MIYTDIKKLSIISKNEYNGDLTVEVTVSKNETYVTTLSKEAFTLNSVLLRLKLNSVNKTDLVNAIDNYSQSKYEEGSNDTQFEIEFNN